MEEGGIEALADHLGLGSRHLRRLFLRHLGATPSAIAQTRRLHFAKKLIDETSLPMTQIAIAAGFGSVRRFNAAIFNVYHRTPTQIRDLAPQKGDHPENQYLFRLEFRPPYAWTRILGVLAAQAIPGVEAVDGGTYRRSISSNGAHGYLEVSLDEARNALNVRVQIAEPRSLFFIIERVRGIFDLNADWATIERTLKADPELAARIEAAPGLRVAGCWSGFELAVRTILDQSGAAAASAVAGRIVQSFGAPFPIAAGVTHLFPTPEVLADADLKSTGLADDQALAVQSLARAVCEERVSFDKVADPDAVVAQLSMMPGFSDSSVQYVAMRALREPDAFPCGRGVLAAKLEQRSRAWRPWRAYAAAYLNEPDSAG